MEIRTGSWPGLNQALGHQTGREVVRVKPPITSKTLDAIVLRIKLSKLTTQLLFQMSQPKIMTLGEVAVTIEPVTQGGVVMISSRSKAAP